MLLSQFLPYMGFNFKTEVIYGVLPDLFEALADYTGIWYVRIVTKDIIYIM